MPVLGNSAVTQAIPTELAKEYGFKRHMCFCDSRKLRVYFRFLQSGRLQIGSVGGVTVEDNNQKIQLKIIRNTMLQKFPELAEIDIEYFWSGWMDISHDFMPRIIEADKKYFLCTRL